MLKVLKVCLCDSGGWRRLEKAGATVWGPNCNILQTQTSALKQKMGFRDEGASHNLIDAGLGTGKVPSATVCYLRDQKKSFAFCPVSTQPSDCACKILSSVPLVLIMCTKL